jgi:hypothetical protein
MMCINGSENHNFWFEPKRSKKQGVIQIYISNKNLPHLPAAGRDNADFRG